MSLKRILLNLIVLSPISLSPLAASAQTQAVPGRAHTQATKEPPARPMDHTPLNRLLIPYLKAHLGSTANGKASVAKVDSARPASSAALGQPNFGGYLTAPFYPGRLEASCVTDPYNCGVTVELSADFDKDGKSDIAVVQADGTLNILLNTGGALSSPVSYFNPNFSSSFIGQGFALDVNNDGYADVVELDTSNNALIVYLNQKNGTFGAAQTITLDSTNGYVNSIAFGDVNGDGSLDFVAITANLLGRNNGTVTVQTYLGTGTGTFTTPGASSSLTQTVSIPAQIQIQPNFGITLGDLNKDGKLDIAADLEEQSSQSAGEVVATVALGKGDGSFGPINVNNPITVPVVQQPGIPFLIFQTAGVQIIDLNNDTKPDVAMDQFGTLFVALGDGTGGFTSTAQSNTGSSNQLVYADVTGDGIPDIVQDNGLLNIWIGKGDGTFSLPVNGNSYILDSGGLSSLAVTDINGDGSPDIAQLGEDYKQVSLFFGNGKGSFAGAAALSTTTDGVNDPFFLLPEEVGDIVGNGYSDVLFIDANVAAPYVVSGLSDGKGGFTYITAVPASAVPLLSFLQPVSADFNGDGKQDLVIANGDGTMSVALSKGDGTFQTPVALALPKLDCEVSYAATGDLNKDGHADIVVTYPGDASCGGSDGTASGYFVALGAGDGTFGTPAFTSAGGELYSAAIGDFNSDGIPDLVLNDEPFDGAGGFAVDLLTGNGDGTFSVPVAVSSNFLVSQVIAGDYNQDGKLDLVLMTEGESTDTNPYDTAGIILLPGNGDGTFSASSEVGNGSFFLNATLADVNDDGIPDIVAALYRTPGQPNTYYGLSTLLGTGHGGFAAPINSLESLDSYAPLAGNFLADNSTDFIVTTGYGPGLFLGQGGSSLSLATSGASIAFGQSETLTVALSATVAGRPAPTGTISFFDGAMLLGTASVSGTGATYSASMLAVGSHTITAVYSGDSNFNQNKSSAAVVTVTNLAPAFTMAATPGTVSVSAGAQAVATLTLTANATFSGNIALTCSGLPTGAACVVNPSQVTLAAGGTTQASIFIGTTTTASSRAPHSFPLSGYAGGLSLAGLLCCFARRRFPRAVPFLLAGFVLALGTAGLSGCGGGGSGIKTAAKGSYTVTVTATPSGSTASAQTTTIAVTVQ
jgi:hypothetical protein